MRTKKFKTKSSTGMCPNMTVIKPKKRKKPNPYRAPLTVKRYYSGIKYGIELLKESILESVEDEELRDMIKEKARVETFRTTRALTELEKKKTKEKMDKWEEEEWEKI